MRLLRRGSSRFRPRVDYTYPEIRSGRTRRVRKLSLVGRGVASRSGLRRIRPEDGRP